MIGGLFEPRRAVPAESMRARRKHFLNFFPAPQRPGPFGLATVLSTFEFPGNREINRQFVGILLSSSLN